MKSGLSGAWGLRVLLALAFGVLAAGSPAPRAPLPGEAPGQAASATPQAGAHPDTLAPADFVLDYVADMRGNLEPCG